MRSFVILAASVSALCLSSCNEKEVSEAETATDNYPLKTCVVSGEELGSMGEPIIYKHEGTTVKFCCEGCIDEFKEEPAKFLAKLTKPE